jgi:polyhydroxybutyrate depolymerase
MIIIVAIMFVNVATGIYFVKSPSSQLPSITHSTTPFPLIVKPGTTERQHFLLGLERYYLIHVSKIYDSQKSVPLLLFFHGSGMNPNQVVDLGFNDRVDEFGGLVVYPAAAGIEWRTDKIINDYNFTLEIIYRISQQYKIDPNRIYCSGHSAGGFMAYELGARFPDVFAAIAPNAASMGFADNVSAPWYFTEPKGPVSVIVFHGTKDPNIPYSGAPLPWGFVLLSPMDSIAIWANSNGCDATPQNTTSLDGKIIKTLYMGGVDGTEVVLYSMVGLYHVFPNPYNSGVSAVGIIWDFFMSHPKIINSENYVVTERSPTGFLSVITPNGTRTVIYKFTEGIEPYFFVIDSYRNYIVNEFTVDRISKVTPTGIRSLIYNFTTATKSNPSGIAIDSAGNYIITEVNAEKLSKVTPSGIRTVVYNFTLGTYPSHIVIDSLGNYIVSEPGKNLISKITPTGVRTVIYTFPGSQKNNVWGIAIDTSGNYIVTEFENDKLSKVTPNGIRTIIFNFTAGTMPSDVAIDSSGNYIVAESHAHILSKITPAGVRTMIYNWPQATNMQQPSSVAIIWMPKIIDLRITVKDSFGTVISGANISSTSQPSIQSTLAGVSYGDGRFVFTGVSLGNYTMQAQKSGYISSTEKVSVVREGMIDTIIILQATSRLKVEVKDSSGTVIPGANILSTIQPSGQPALSGASNVNGTTIFSDLIPGNYTVQATKSSYYSSSESINISPGDTSTITITLKTVPTTGILKVTVKDSNGAAITGATVTTTSQPSGQTALNGISATNGTAKFTNLLPGSYAIQASKDGYATGLAQGIVVAGETAETSITLQVQGGIPGWSFEAILIGTSLSIFLDKIIFPKPKTDLL